MKPSECVMLRDVKAGDLAIFYEQQLDAEANWMAAFVGKNPRDRAAFDGHWERNLRAAGNTTRTIVAGGAVAGHIACFLQEGELEVTYWLGKEFWGRGIATEALRRMLRVVRERPILALAAADNLRSTKVLQRCGFHLVGRDRGFAHGRGGETEEIILRLDRALADAADVADVADVADGAPRC